jgi:hypothetical protein
MRARRGGPDYHSFCMGQRAISLREPPTAKGDNPFGHIAEPISSAPARSSTMVAKAVSISLSVRAERDSKRTPRMRAAGCKFSRSVRA